MAYYKVTQKQSGGSGPVTPTFSETTIVDNPNYNTSITFSEDYHNYDFLKFIIYNASSGVETSIITTPSTIDAVFSIGGYINFNEFCNNQYCTYTQSNLTWNRSGSRSCLISKVIGLNCTNLTVEETEIYKATSQTGASVDITTQEDLMSFDWILFCSNDGSYDEVQPCINIFVPSNNIYELKDNYSLMYVFNPYNTYSVVYIGRNHISSNTYAYVVGIKFT